MDLHAITVPHDPVDLRASTRTMAATYLAAGIDPKRVSAKRMGREGERELRLVAAAFHSTQAGAECRW